MSRIRENEKRHLVGLPSIEGGDEINYFAGNDEKYSR